MNFIYREPILTIRDFEKKFMGGRKAAGAATATEANYLIKLNNDALELRDKIYKAERRIAELRERELSLLYFISERAGLV